MAVWIVRALDDRPSQAVNPFADVDDGEWWAPYVVRLGEIGVTSGCSTEPMQYCPDRAVTRAQMATFLLRSFQLDPAGPPARFTDIDDNDTHAKGIDALANSGITAGCQTDPPRFCPHRQVTRAQMATFLARGLYLQPIPSNVPVTADTHIATGQDLSCAISADQSITCSGDNYYGQADAPDGQYRQVAVGYQHSCAIAVDQTITCWGANGYYETEAPDGQYRQVAAGYVHSCAVTLEQTITCWGGEPNYDEEWDHYDEESVDCDAEWDSHEEEWDSYDGDGEWDPYDPEDYYSFGQADTPDGQYSQVTAGYGHSCAIALDGTITCWGNNSHGQTNAPPGTYQHVAGGYRLSCAITTDRKITCWGDNHYGQANAPNGQYRQLAAGHLHSCAIALDGTTICWGDNSHGQTNAPPGTYQHVAGGYRYSCAITTDRKITCWGG